MSLKPFTTENVPYEFEKYVCSKETLKETLDTFGVAVIPNVLSDIECEEMTNGMWDFFEHLTQNWGEERINRFDENTYKNFYKLFPMHGMLHQHFNVGHCQALWDVRQNPKVVDIFRYFWFNGENPAFNELSLNDSPPENEELIVSFDGACFAPPHEITKRGYYRRHNWFHSDQAISSNGFKCVQSWITSMDVNEGDSTLVFLENSHLFHKEFTEKNVSMEEKTDKKNQKDWYKLEKQEDLNFYLQTHNCEIKKIKCPRGSIVLWDSRTIHAGCEALKTRVIPNFRSIAYLCYMPKVLSSSKNNEKRKKAFEMKRTCTHYVLKNNMCAKNPRTYSSNIGVPETTMIKDPVLSILGLSLI